VPLTAILGRRERFEVDVAPWYAALVESTDDAIVTTGLDGTILSWSAGAERMHGFTATEAIGQRLSLIVPADRAGEILQVLRSVIRGDRVGRFESIRTRRDRTRLDVSVAVSGVRDSTGRVIGALMVARDIGESKTTESLLHANRVALDEARELLERAERSSRTGSWIYETAEPTSLRCSPECVRVLGPAAGTPITVESFFAMVHPDDDERVHDALERALDDHRSYDIHYRIVDPDGSVRWLRAWADPECDERGEPVRVLGVVQDVTERRAADEALRTSERRFRLLAENARDLIFRIAVLPEPHFEYVSPSSLAITGFTPEDLYADPSLTTSLIAAEHVVEIETLLRDGGMTAPLDVEVRRKDGSVAWVNEQLTFVRDDAGDVVAVEGIVRDITERKRAEAQLVHVGRHDALTGLPNRAALCDLVEEARTRASAAGHAVVVTALDLDDFTLINDTHGHDVGDVVLRAVSERLSHASRDGASVARTGSDEFVVIGSAATGEQAAAAFVERARVALLQPVRSGDVELFVRAGFGVAVDAASAAPRLLLRNADIALAHAKRNRAGAGVEFFNSEMRTRTNARFALASDLHRALERDEFELRYQPIVRLADDAIVGAEALIRWRHPQRGLIGPTDFIPLAEDTGLIVDIGAWVVTSACTALRRLSDSDPKLAELGLSVNVSVKQLRVPGLVETVAAALARFEIAPGRLTVEMTESVFADDLGAIDRVLGELRALGVRIAVDDFGTGYSSLAYLKHLPFDTLKIDRSIVEGLGSDPCDEAIVASALGVSRALGLLAVAEGVETAEQLATLKALGCEAAQGFYFSEPVSTADLAALVVGRVD